MSDDTTDPLLDSEPVDLGNGKLLYDCTPWAGETRRLFASLLDGRGVSNAWQGTSVAVMVADLEVVEELRDEALATARPSLDPSVERLVYEVGSWPVGLQTEFANELTASDIAYEWDGNGDLVVAQADEEIVEEILDLLPEPETVDDSADDGVAVHQILNELFNHSHRLASKPGDSAATVGLVRSFEDLRGLAVPFGFDSSQWSALVESARRTREAVDPSVGEDLERGSEPASDGDVAALAAKTRDLLRLYI